MPVKRFSDKELKYFFNQILKHGDIPNSVTHLKFEGRINHNLEQGVIPNSVTKITFNHLFNKINISRGLLTLFTI